ncbi:MAG: PD-(D/E)XK nuclease family transposase [Oscillospiraceae bacterium]|nr:PD-(D/E)XK nuclease family transposase [Oscillospiraceae bacterium]
MNPEESRKLYSGKYDSMTDRFRLMDDDFMTLVFGGNIEATQLLLRIILDDPKITVIETIGQFEIKNQNGRSVRLDIHAVDANGQHFDVEIQRANSGAGAKCARFNSSMLDTRMAKVGDKVPNLKPSYVIFITERDILGGGFPLYHIDRRIEELDYESFGDGSHIVYVNGEYKNEETPIGMLMHDFRCTSADEMHYDILANRVRYFKETEGGRVQMCKMMEELTIMTTIETARRYGVSEDTILADIMKQFELSETEAKEYMLKKSA